ncbi:hypothetical protein [Rheinheimera sp. MMS21-TC3]|uniref:hypothetical protein n=1 Tax=Rheinheimera sp. MMS21-TC3 TaxID=3072790 RepID=UPI0028C4BEAE|nr:hypothetical protein [Rheinheimera sp. MMS21-TC3]WNO61513.1 hypothetical protein RDV63_11285 [Rheinheimera sp. MMS21-TC3]
MNLSPSQNNLLKTLGITPLKLSMAASQTSEAAVEKVPQKTILPISANLLLDLQILLPQLTQVVKGSGYAIEQDCLIVPEEFNFSSLDKKQLWQFLQQQSVA